MPLTVEPVARPDMVDVRAVPSLTIVRVAPALRVNVPVSSVSVRPVPTVKTLDPVMARLELKTASPAPAAKVMPPP